MSKILYFGTDPKNFSCYAEVIHCPLVKIVPRDPREQPVLSAYKKLPKATHILFTSKNSVRIFFDHIKQLEISLESIKKRSLLAVGSSTAAALLSQGIANMHVAADECQEGLIAKLCSLDLDRAHLFLPHSSLARPNLVEFFIKRGLEYTAFDLYDTVAVQPKPLPNLEEFEEIVFTSPSVVHAFMRFFPTLPEKIRIRVQGAITEKALKSYLTAKKQEIFYV